jgi:ERCC3/RAD25/XPB C-terminal helicase
VTPAGAQFGPVGYECNLLYLACLAALVLGGSGPLAIDGLLRKWRKNEHSYDGHAARFFTLVSRDTREEEFAHHRKLFLTEQGYSHQVHLAEELSKAR